MPTGQNYSSTAPQTNLVGGITNSQTNCNAVSLSGWPSTPFSFAFEIGTPSQELCDVASGGVSGNAITSMTRGVDGSSATSHSNNATMTHVAIGRDFREFRAHVDASASNDGQGHNVHGLTVGSSVVGTTDVQTLTNKTLTSPTITGMTVSNPAISGTVTGAASYDNITALTTAVGSSPLISKGIASETAPVLDVQDSSANHLFRVLANGATGAGAVSITPIDTGTSSLVVNAPAGLSGVNIADFQIGGTSEVRIDQFGQVFIEHGALSMAGVTGAANTSRYAGSTTGGPPVSGSFNTGDYVVDQTNAIIWTCTAGGSPGTWNTPGEVLLAKQSLGAPAGTVTFSSIPQYFRHLKIRFNGKTSWAGGAVDTVFLTFNNITTANYEWLVQSVTNAGAPANQNAAGATSAWCGLAWGNSFASQGSGINEVFIPDYTLNTFGKSFTWTGHAGDGGSTHEYVAGGGSLAPGSLLGAVTRIDLITTNANWVAGSTFELYGIS